MNLELFSITAMDLIGCYKHGSLSQHGCKSAIVEIAKQYAIEMCFKQRVLCSIVRQTKTSWSDGRMSTNNVRMKTQIEMKKDILNAEPPQELRGEE